MTKHKNRDDLYYWCYENKKLCIVMVMLTILINIKHNLQNSKEHNDSSDTYRKDIITDVHNLKQKVMNKYEHNNMSAQIIHVEITAVPSISQSSWPNNHALCQIIKGVHRKHNIPIQQGQPNFYW